MTALAILGIFVLSLVLALAASSATLACVFRLMMPAPARRQVSRQPFNRWDALLHSGAKAALFAKDV